MPTEGLYFWRVRYNRHTINWMCHIANDCNQWKFCHNFYKDWTQPRLSRHMTLSPLSRDFEAKNGWKTSSSVGIEPATLRSTFYSAELLFRLAFFRLDLSALVKWLFGRITLRRLPFFMAGSRAQPLKGIAIKTIPAPTARLTAHRYRARFVIFLYSTFFTKAFLVVHHHPGYYFS